MLGPGLLGGSLLHDARRLGWANVRAYARKPETVRKIQEQGLAHVASSDLAEAVADASFIIFASPVGTYADLATRLLDLPLAANVIVTDVGSVKACVVSGAGEILRKGGVTFVGSHPMAGSEAKGLDAAKSGMFDDAACILTPTSDVEISALERVRVFWKSLGSRIYEMDATDHDRTVASISHMPHLAAAAVVLAALEAEPGMAKFGAGGLRDTTRVASGDPDMWREILLENRQAVLATGRELQRKLHDLLEFIEKVEDQPLHAALSKAKSLRDARYHPPASI